MFCPRCAEQNTDDAKFCRVCGADIHLVPQALAGHLSPEARTDRQRVEKGVKLTIVGAGLLILAVVMLFVAPVVDAWAIFFATMIASVILLGTGTAELLIARQGRGAAAGRQTAELNSAAVAGELPPARVAAGMQPGMSVTETTTRSLGVEKVAGRVAATAERAGEED